MTQEIRLILPYPISTNAFMATRIVRDKKTGRQIAIPYLTNEAKAYKAELGWRCKQAGIRKPLTGRVDVSYTLYPKRPLDWAKRARLDPLNWDTTVRRLDLDNAQKVVFDALKGIAFGDDILIWHIDARQGEPDGEPRMEIIIKPLEPEIVQGALI